MKGQNPIVRPYCPGVRVGNWFEDIALEEDILRDYLDKRERGELICQKKTAITEFLGKKVELSVSRDGNVHFGDVIMIVNPQPEDCSRCTQTLCMTLPEDTLYNIKERLCAETKDVVGSKNVLKADIRSGVLTPSLEVEVEEMSDLFNLDKVEIFTALDKNCDGSHDGEPVRYYQPFYLSTPDGKQFLTSDMKTLILHSKKARHQKVWLDVGLSRLCEWRIIPIAKKFRMELEHTPVPANVKVLVNHARTNNCLCLEEGHLLSTYFGRETEISAFTWFDAHGVEFDRNHWMLVLHTPGSDVLDVPPPAEGMTECPQICQNTCMHASDADLAKVPAANDQATGH